jgi:hypothetical protein
MKLKNVEGNGEIHKEQERQEKAGPFYRDRYSILPESKFCYRAHSPESILPYLNSH